MSSESEEDRERLVQAARMLFFHMQDLASFTNILVELFNCSMNTQINHMTVKEDGNIKDVFEQTFRIFKEMQSVLEAKSDQMQKEPLRALIGTAVCSLVEESPDVKELHQSAKEVFKDVHTQVIFSVLTSSNILRGLESSVSLLMKYPITNLWLNDLYRKDTKEQSDATSSEKSTSPGPPQISKIDTLKKLQDVLKTEQAKNTIKSAEDQLEQVVNTLLPILEVLQKLISTLKTKTPVPKKAKDQ